MSCSYIVKKYGFTKQRCHQILSKNKQYKTFKSTNKQKKINACFYNCIHISKKLGRIPTYKEVRKAKIDNYALFNKHIRPKLIKFGYKTVREITKQTLLDEAVKLFYKLKTMPSAHTLQRIDPISYQYHWGSLKNFHKAIKNEIKKK